MGAVPLPDLVIAAAALVATGVVLGAVGCNAVWLRIERRREARAAFKPVASGAEAASRTAAESDEGSATAITAYAAIPSLIQDGPFARRQGWGWP